MHICTYIIIMLVLCNAIMMGYIINKHYAGQEGYHCVDLWIQSRKRPASLPYAPVQVPTHHRSRVGAP
jgi:hypothetical protein